MASAVQIAELRRLIDEPNETTYTDEVLIDRLDAAASVQQLASDIWTEKAARYAGLIDIQEGNSNRKLSQLQSQALKMASSFDSAVAEGASTFRPARTRKIERQ